MTGARAEFAASLPRRLDVVRAVLRALSEDPGDLERKQSLVRRLHALGSGARVLGFASVAEAMAEAERALERAGSPSQRIAALAEVARAIDVAPSLLLGSPMTSRVSEPALSAVAEPIQPANVLVFGTAALAAALGSEGPLEVERTEDREQALEFARVSGPNLVIVDADRPGARELVEGLAKDPLVERVPVLVVGNFANASAAAAYVSLGAERVVPKPVSPDVLARTALELCGTGARVRTEREPLGNRTVEELVERISSELKKGLVDSLEAGGRATQVAFADGTDVLAAVWGAIARVRELVTLKSSGSVRFLPSGPEGGVPVAPWMVEDRRAGERRGPARRGLEDVGLRGRRCVVADDDPAVVWFLSDLLRAVGAEVIEAHDGQAALERTFEVWPDLVISDVLMPGRDGFSLCHEIHRDVAVRDVPVILLSWKEDLLQRVRELGADANGYLRKETAASTVVERVREVLVPRARVEQRLRAGGEVRGRLDGLTPRLLLQLVSRWIPDASVTFRDAVYLHEAHIREGRVRSVSRSASDGSFERGPRVLAGLLGVNSGRFIVQPDAAPCRREFDAELVELLSGPIARARVALSALGSDSLSRVVRVSIDSEAIGRYLECTPASARKLIERLMQGAAPRDLLAAGDTSLGLLESVLSDLARRGSIDSVQRDDGPVRLSAPPPVPAPAPPLAAGEGGSLREAVDEASELAETELGSLDSSWSDLPEPLIANSADNVSDEVSFSFQLDQSASQGMPPVVAGLPENASVGSSTLAGTVMGIGPQLADATDESERTTLRPDPTPIPNVSPNAEAMTPASAEIFVGLLGSTPAAIPGEGRASDELAARPHESPRVEHPSEDVVAIADEAKSEPAPLTPRMEGSATPKEDDGAEPLDEDVAPISAPRVALRENIGEERASDESLDLDFLRDPSSADRPPDSGPRSAGEHVVRTRSGFVPAAEAKKARSETPEPPGVETERRGAGGRTLLLSLLAFGAAYAVVRWGVAPLLAPGEEAPPAPVTSASAEPAAPSRDQFRLTSETLAIEPGVDVGTGNGLIEIVGADRDALYVDGTLVGRGPRRLVPSPPGAHEIRVARGNENAVLQIQVATGRRVRVSASGSSP